MRVTTHSNLRKISCIQAKHLPGAGEGAQPVDGTVTGERDDVP